MSESPSVFTFEAARRCVEEHAARIPAPVTETADLLSAAGRVLAEPVLADRELPPFPRSTRDGYAVRAADLANVPVKLRVIGEVRAGAQPNEIPSDVLPGQAVSIMTGAPLPQGADAIVMVEYSSTVGGSVEISKTVAAGENIVPCGAEARQGSQLIEPGTRLNDAAIALAATAGKAHLQVFRRPTVAILTTGDEIVAIDVAPGPTQIRNSNSYSLAVQVRNAGGQPTLLPIAPDEREPLRKLIAQGLTFDLLLLTGGVSMGRYDLVEQVLADLHAEFFFTGAQIQPGRPVVFGRCASASGHKYFFGLPGNPVSTMVTFELFARPLLEALAGMSPRKLVFLSARLKSEVRVKPGLRRFLPALLSGEFADSSAELLHWQGSGDIATTARANCYLVVPPDRERLEAGEWVSIMPRT